MSWCVFDSSFFFVVEGTHTYTYTSSLSLCCVYVYFFVPGLRVLKHATILQPPFFFPFFVAQILQARRYKNGGLNVV